MIVILVLTLLRPATLLGVLRYANSAGPDQTPQRATSDQSLDSLLTVISMQIHDK